MTEKSINYFNEIIMTFIKKHHSDILNEMSFTIVGSVGLGIDDELSDVEAIIYLPDEIWKQNGMLQINLDKCLLETNLWKQNGSIICVHPLSWLLDGHGEKILESGKVPWLEVQLESLFPIQNQPIWYDQKGRLVKLRELTAPDKMPEIIWKKALLEKLKAFVSDGVQELKRCIDRMNYLDAYIPFGDTVKTLLEIGFIVCRQYYPYRKHLNWAFSKLPSPISNISLFLNKLSSVTDWQERLDIIEKIYELYKNYIVSKKLLPEIDFDRVNLVEMPLHDNEFDIVKNILNNRNWRVEQDILMEKTLKAGFEPEAVRWVGWWKMV